MIRLDVGRSACGAARADQALAALDDREGVYFGVDAGIAGLHPLQAALVAEPALRLRLHGDGVECEPLTAFGLALLRHPTLLAWQSRNGRGQSVHVVQQLREFLACFEPSADTLLVGALPFEAHRLRQGARDAGALGVLYFPELLLRRDGNGRWEELRFGLEGGTAAGLSPERPGLLGTPNAQPAAEPADDYQPGGYAAMVQRALGVLRQRPLVSLTLSQSYRRRVDMAPSKAFARLRAANPAPATFFVNDGSGLRLFGASPDLQLVISAGQVQALPVCGTVARRPGAQGEAESLRELFNEEVDAAALAVCSDALRNDLAPLCEPGSLRLQDRRRPMSLATVVHAVDRVGGRLRAGADAWDAIAATAAPVMLTGTPRAEALRAIAELEASPRGWYGGLMVQVAANGDALVGTILRAAAVRDGIAEVRTGGDLLADSSPQREEAESRLKTRSLWRAFGLEAAPVAAQPGAAVAASSITVRLHADGDPFADSLADCLASLGIRCSDAAVRVVAGPNAGSVDPYRGPLVAVGDAGYLLLRATGAVVEPCPAEHGRALHCTDTRSGAAFTAARYAIHRLAAAPPAEWTVRAIDAHGAPVLLMRGTTACILYRPDSLLSDDTARLLFATTIAEVGRL